MNKVNLHNLKGEKIGEEKLNPEIFDIDIKESVVHRVVEAYLSNQRKNIAATKDRSEVRGGGRKPWKQKGTGRARAGSTRSPIWKGGGVTFGPTPEVNYKKKVNKKEKRKALFMTLTDKVQDKGVMVVDEFKLAEIKTKKVTEIIKKMKIDDKKVLVVLSKKDDKAMRSIKNLEKVDSILASMLNAYKVLHSDVVLIDKKSLKVLDETFLK